MLHGIVPTFFWYRNALASKALAAPRVARPLSLRLYPLLKGRSAAASVKSASIWAQMSATGALDCAYSLGAKVLVHQWNFAKGRDQVEVPIGPQKLGLSQVGRFLKLVPWAMPGTFSKAMLQ